MNIPSSSLFDCDSRSPLFASGILAIAVILLSFTGITASPWDNFYQITQNGNFANFWGSIGAHFAVFYLFSRPSRHERVLWVISSCILLFVVYRWVPHLSFPGSDYTYAITLTGLSIGNISGVFLLLRALRPKCASAILARQLLSVVALMVVITFFAIPYLRLTQAFHPATYDIVLFKLDATLGFQPSTIVALLAQKWPAVRQFLFVVYASLPYALGLLLALQIAHNRRPRLNAMAAWLICTWLAILLYHLLPVTGPSYVFGEQFPAGLPSAEKFSLITLVVPPAFRNGVPSMHFGWALLLWLIARTMDKLWLRRLFAAQMLTMVVATLALGEHYLLDLIVAVPLIVAVVGLATRIGWDHPPKRRAILGGFALTLAWMLLIRFIPGLFIQVPGITWIALLLTLGISVWLYLPLERTILQQPLDEPTALPTESHAVTTIPTQGRKDVRLAAAMFVISGFAGLVYEVLFAKSLALTFGSMSTATYTVLATYMGGMAIGSWLGGKLASGRAHPLVAYAFCELSIAIYCLATPAIFTGVKALYVSMAVGIPPDAGYLIVLRLMLGGVTLLVPTVLMGMTLPILARFFKEHSFSLGGSVAVLYGANTLGAALGALLAGYLVIPSLGVWGTTLFAAFANLLVALFAFRLFKQLQLRDGSPMQSKPVAHDISAIPATQTDRRLGYFALITLTIGGAVTLALEVKYMHLLAVVAGNSTYAFSLMLFTFLIGLGAGATLAHRLLATSIRLAAMLAWLELALAAVILLGVFQWSDLPTYFASYANYPLVRDFSSREVIRGIVCWLAMFPPALFIGTLYPIAMECVGRAFRHRPIEALGYAAALNTIGNIAGVLLGGFLLLPLLGALKSVQLLAAVCFTLGVSALLLFPPARRKLAWSPVPVVAALLWVQPATLDYTALASGANVYFQPQGYGETIDHAESLDGGLTSVAKQTTPTGETLLTLLTNGKFQGNNSDQGEMQAQVGFALSPLLHTQARERVLVIGYGSGVSARTLHEAGFKQMDMIDLSADIIKLANRHFANVNSRVTDKPGVTTYITDGRNFLLLQPQQYDVISMEISSIWFAGAASLYNREFYHLTRQRLTEHGVLQQWVQLHHTTPFDMLRIMGSVRSEFRYVWLYLIGNQGMIIATNDAQALPSLENVRKLDNTETLKPLLSLYKGSARSLLDTMLLDPEGTNRMLSSLGVSPNQLVSTDDNLYLEYSTPKGNVLNSQQSYAQNVSFIKRFSPKPAE